MNKREAKRLAWWSAAAVVQNALDCGWEYEDRLESEKDAERFSVAIAEIIREMEAKGR